ncbi:MAG: hypothetical protein IKN71_05465 [Alphaproteobacteria bacterium]|jgi:hypothetical protein|nr:hypothetical protein [Alphaproteobacteria bacterium]
MLSKIRTIEDVKFELTRYFETLRALPAPERPDYAKNYLWQLLPSEPNDDDKEAAGKRFQPTTVDIADCWYMDANFIPLLTKFEYKLLSRRLRDKPLPWKVIEHETNYSRQWLKFYMDKALQRLFVHMKS